MTPPTRVTFIKYQPSDRSSRDRESQRSKARSHAAQIGHQRLRLKSSFRQHGSSEIGVAQRPGQTLIPFRLRRLPILTPSSPDASHTVSNDSSPDTVSCVEDLLSPSQLPEAIYYDSDQQQYHHNCRPQDDAGEEQTHTSVVATLPSRSHHRERFPFKISILNEGFTGLRTDPFSCIPGAKTSHALSAIDFYTQIISPANDTVCYIFNVSNVYASFLESLQDETFVDAGYGVVQFLKEQAHTPGSPPSVHTLKYKGRALVKIRDRLSKPVGVVDDVTIFAMIFLAALNRALQNIEEHEIHRRSIALIVAQQGGLQSLRNGSAVKGYLMHYDTFWAMETGETMFPGERRPHQPIYPDYPFSTAMGTFVTKLPQGFQKLVVEGVLSYDILSILSRATYITRLSNRERFELLTRTRRSMNQYNDFWEASPCLSILDDSDPLLETLLSLTLICYSFMAFESRSYPTPLRGSRARATRCIASYSPRSEAEEKCLIWMWIVITDSWRMGNRLQGGGAPSLHALQMRFPNFRHVNAVVELGKQFLWTGYLTKSVHLYWDDLVRRSDTSTADCA